MPNYRDITLNTLNLISTLSSRFGAGTLIGVLNKEGIVDKIKNFDYQQISNITYGEVKDKTFEVLEGNKDMFIIAGIAMAMSSALVKSHIKCCKDLKLFNRLKNIKPFPHNDEIDITYLKQPNPQMEIRLRDALSLPILALFKDDGQELARSMILPLVRNMGQYLFRSGYVPDISLGKSVSTYNPITSEQEVRIAFPDSYEEAIEEIKDKARDYDDPLFRRGDQFAKLVGGLVFYSIINQIDTKEPLENGTKWALASLCSQVSKSITSGIILHYKYSRSKPEERNAPQNSDLSI
jgi:hypothetical protein